MTPARILRVLHWLIVASVAIAYGTAYYRLFYTSQTESSNWYVLVVHMNVGLIILLLSVLMLVYRLLVMRPLQVKRKVYVQAMHYALYTMLILIPLAAFIGMGFDFPLLNWVNIPNIMRFEYIQALVQSNFHVLLISFIEPFANFHRDIGSAVILPILLVGHIVGAVYHYIFEARFNN